MPTYTIPKLRVRKCCPDNNEFYYEVHKDDTITFSHTGERFYDLDNVRFCMWCGKRLETYAEDPTEIMKAHEELKKQMERDQALQYAKLSPAEKAKHDLRVEMKRDDAKKRRKK